MKTRQRSFDADGARILLSPADLAKMIDLEAAHTAHVQANPMIWLPNRAILKLDLNDGPKFGFQGVVRMEDLDFDFADLESHEDLENLKAFHRKQKKNKGGGRNPQPQGPQNMPSGNVVDAVVAKYLASMTAAGPTGNVILGEQNALFGDRQKARTYASAWTRVVTPAHITCWSEIVPDFLQELATTNGYNYVGGTPNSRKQGVGITYHSRFQLVKGPFEIKKTGQAAKIPDLRDDLVAYLLDSWSGWIVCVVAVHRKSMRGGAKFTEPVRYQENVDNVNYLGNAKPGMKPVIKNIRVFNIWKNQVFGRGFTDHGTCYATMAMCPLSDDIRKMSVEDRIAKGVGVITVMQGDWNCLLGDPSVTCQKPLEQAGYGLVNPALKVSTQAHGGRLDGIHAESGTAQPGCNAGDGVKDDSGEVTVDA